MDYYLVSVFENQGLTAVEKMCEQGKQKLALRNDTLRWAIQQHENELVNLLIKYTDVHHDGAMPTRLAALVNNETALEKILAVSDVGGSAIDRFKVYVDLVHSPTISSYVLKMIGKSFSDDVFDKVHNKMTKRVQWYMEIAQWDFERHQKFHENKASDFEKGVLNISKPNLVDNEYYQQAVQLQKSLDTVRQLRTPSKKQKM